MANRTQSQDEPGSRERILRGANRLLRRQGYSATSLSAIAAEGKAPMGSVYFHFPGGKEQLAAEALRYGASGVSEAMAKKLELGDPADALAGCATLWADVLEATQWAGGCPVAATALETSSTSETLRKVSAQVLAEWRDAMAKRLVLAGMTGQAASEIAELALSLLEGAELLVRVQRDRAPLDNAAAHIHSIVNLALGRRAFGFRSPRSKAAKRSSAA